MERQAASVAAAGGRKSSELLTYIDIPADAKPSIRKELNKLGFSRSMIYPDLVGLAQELGERAKDGSL